jgi:hypothetical protein
MSGNTISATAMVPSSFDVEPFKTKGFAMGHNIYVSTRSSSASLKGVWGGVNWGDDGPFNAMMALPQFFTLIRPVSGRKFEVTVTNFPFHSTSENVNASFSDSLTFAGPGESQDLSSRNGWTGASHNGGVIVNLTKSSEKILELKCEYKDDPSYGYAYSTKLANNLTNCYIEFGPIKETIFDSRYIDSLEVYSRFGPMVRFNGTLSNASFYALAIGDVNSNNYSSDDETGSRSARLVRVQSTDLSYNWSGRSYAYAGSAWSPSATVSALWASDITLQKGNKYRLKAVSTLISVEQSAPPYSSWSVIASAVDSTIASGAIGIFSQNVNDSNTRGIRIYGPLVVSDLTTPALTIEAQFMFLQVGPEANLTMESG